VLCTNSLTYLLTYAYHVTRVEPITIAYFRYWCNNSHYCMVCNVGDPLTGDWRAEVISVADVVHARHSSCFVWVCWTHAWQSHLWGWHRHVKFYTL